MAARFVLGYAYRALQALRGQSRFARGGELTALTQGWLNPWYAVRFLPFAGLERDRVAQVVAVLRHFLADVTPLP